MLILVYTNIKILYRAFPLSVECVWPIFSRSGPEVPKEVAVSTEVSSLGPRGSAPFTVASSMLLLHTQVRRNWQECRQFM